MAINTDFEQLVLQSLANQRATEVKPALVRDLAQQQGLILGAAELVQLSRDLQNNLTGLGILEEFVTPGVSDILVNADGLVWVEEAGNPHPVPTGLKLSGAQSRQLAVRLATLAGRRLDDAMPFVDAQLPSSTRFPHGVRMHALLPPLGGKQTVISLRIPQSTNFSLAALQRRGMFSESLMDFLRKLIHQRISFLLSGGTGSGKTTLLNALLSEVSPDERIIMIEDARELDPTHPHVLSLQSRHPNVEGKGGVDLDELVRQSLRMRPDRIVVGECRGREVLSLLQALNTGHEGGCATVHANSTQDVPARLEALAQLAGVDRFTLATQAASAIKVLLHLSRDANGRRFISEIAALSVDRSGRLIAAAAKTDIFSCPPDELWEKLCLT